jgi:hypothetical protein
MLVYQRVTHNGLEEFQSVRDGKILQGKSMGKSMSDFPAMIDERVYVSHVDWKSHGNHQFLSLESHGRILFLDA